MDTLIDLFTLNLCKQKVVNNLKISKIILKFNYISKFYIYHINYNKRNNKY